MDSESRSSATCKVMKVNPGERSVQIGVAFGNAAPAPDTPVVCVGTVTIPPEQEIPAIGELVDAEYQYAALSGGSLFQPAYKGVRPDKVAPDAYGTLKFKSIAAN